MKKKLSIVLYTQGLPFAGDTLDTEPLGGAETAFICLCRELSRLGHDVKAFCLCPSPGIYDGVSYRDIAEFQVWASQGDCDLFICSRFYQVFSFLIPAKLKLLWLHDHLLDADAADLRKYLPSIHFMYCVSNYHAAYTARFFKEDQHKIKITNNGVDLDLVQAATKDVHAKKHKIMFTSRPERGLAEALYIYERVGDKNLELLACTYPYPNEEPGRAFRAPVEALRQKGFTIRFEQFNKSELYRNIAESKAVIYPANTPEIFCIAAVEAQACRTVFLGRQFGALGETVGYPCQRDNNPEIFFHALKKVLEDPVCRQSLEQLGWQHIQKYTWKKTAEQFIDDTLSFLNA